MEYRWFKQGMLRESAEEVWENCQKIHFYCCVMEYFRYGKGDSARWEALRHIRRPIAAMWACYLGHECLEYSTWEGIEGILEQMARDGSQGRRETAF